LPTPTCARRSTTSSPARSRARHLADYAIGDLQGCFAPLERLLEKIGFSRRRDRLWFVGDLVNRGPESLECLRFVRSLGERAVCVLGNHDLHLVCVAEGIEKPRPLDTLAPVLAAPDGEEMVDWLRGRPLLHVEGKVALVHAGLLPEWSVADASRLASEVEHALRGRGYRKLLKRMYGNLPDRWDESLEGAERLRVIINAMTRLRVVDAAGRMVLKYKGEPGEAMAGWTPWFEVAGRRSADHDIVCGHWSALGLRVQPGLMALDSGCVWGRSLTAIRLADRVLYSVPCPAAGGREDQ
jgi:bis(5'-nucleosyl)-tetraphosphatase (symmetrical)